MKIRIVDILFLLFIALAIAGAWGLCGPFIGTLVILILIVGIAVS